MLVQRILVVAACLMTSVGLSAGEEGAKLREIDSSGLKVNFEKGRVGTPKLITTAEELDKEIPNADAIKKQVDFTKEKLLLFAWGGSGQDRLAGKLSADGKAAAFTYSPGRTRDFRRHVHLFVLPKNAEHKLVRDGVK